MSSKPGSETIPAYEREPYRRSLDVEVRSLGEDGGRTFALLDDTLLYPEGGGQPADHGRLDDLPVVDVQRSDGAIRHFLDLSASAGAPAPGPARLTLDWRRRFDHMQQHTAQHLLTAVALERWGWRTTSFHLQPEVCDVELDVAAVEPAELVALEEAVNAEVRAGREVRARRVTPEEYGTLDVRSRGLPAGHRGDVRLVEIAGIDCNTCGGTHVASTAEIGVVKLLGAEPARGGTRLRWIAGGRVRQRLELDEARLSELRALVGASDAELAGVVELKLGQLKDASRRIKFLTSKLAESAADALAGRSRPVIDEHFEDVDAGFLQVVARRFSASDHPGLALLTAAGEQGSFFVVAAGGGGPEDVQADGRRVAEALQARGGGSGRVFQGKADSLAGRDAALATLRDVHARRS